LKCYKKIYQKGLSFDPYVITLRSDKQHNMNKAKRQFTISDRNAQRLHFIGLLYKTTPDDLLATAVGAMWAASFGSYNQTTRAEMLRELDNDTAHDNDEQIEAREEAAI
jgi:hypothetical protein